MLHKKERELRKILKKYPHRKRGMLPEYQELKKIVDARHKPENVKHVLCSKCNHRCHAHTSYGDCHRQTCPCKRCDCPRCDLEYNNSLID